MTATFAYRLTAEGAENTQRAFVNTEKVATKSFNDSGRATRQFNRDLNDLTSHLRKVSDAADRFRNLRNMVLSLAGAGGIALLVKSSLDAAGNIGDMAAQAGVSVEKFQELEFALRRFNVTQNDAVKAMSELNTKAVEFARDNAGGAKSAFQRLGFREVARRSPERPIMRYDL